MVAVVGEAAGSDPASGNDPLHATPSSSQTSTIIPTVAPVIILDQPNIYPFEAHHDDEIGLWYADVSFNVSKLYFPFVRLRLARFQKQSLDGLQLLRSSRPASISSHPIAPSH